MNIKKISVNDLENISFFSSQGGSWSRIYTAKYEGELVIVKVQKVGSLEKTDPLDDRFEIEKNALSLGVKNVVELKAWGDDFDGERFLVLEKLFNFPEMEFNYNKFVNIALDILESSRKMYLNGYRWCADNPNHVMVDSDNKIKIIDFNDDFIKGIPFLSAEYSNETCYDCKQSMFHILTKSSCEKKQFTVLLNRIFDEAVYRMIINEYQSLKDVHQPIYFDPYKDVLRRESEINSSDFGKLLPAGRTCFDRAKIIKDNINDLNTGSFLDIGSNVGWFTFWAEDQGFDSFGIDFDKAKIDFSNLLVEKYNRTCSFSFADVNIEYIKNMNNYDIIIALSILHLYFTQHKWTKKEWIDLLIAISNKVNKYFIFEVSSAVFGPLKIGGWSDLMDLIKEKGCYKSVEKIGNSLQGRPLFKGEK